MAVKEKNTIFQHHLNELSKRLQILSSILCWEIYDWICAKRLHM